MKDSELQKHMEISLYRILCVDKNATAELIKESRKGLLVTFHPDKNRGNEEVANEKTKEINFAYAVLSNPELRKRYDAIYNKYLIAEEIKKRKNRELKVRKELKLVKEVFSSKMKTYLIGYDLKKPGDYLELNETIKHLATWWHSLDSTWIVKTNLTAVQIRDKLTTHLSKSDKLLVVCLDGEGAWTGFETKSSEWLKKFL